MTKEERRDEHTKSSINCSKRIVKKQKNAYAGNMIYRICSNGCNKNNNVPKKKTWHKRAHEHELVKIH